MGNFNTIRLSLPCPRCGQVGETEVDTRFGDTRYAKDLKVGDFYPWIERKAVQNGGRPAEGNFDGEGYLECTQCRKDAFLRVVIRADRITAVELDPTKVGYIQ